MTSLGFKTGITASRSNRITSLLLLTALPILCLEIETKPNGISLSWFDFINRYSKKKMRNWGWKKKKKWLQCVDLIPKETEKENN